MIDRQVIIDGGLIPTARVRNQTLLDALLDRELIQVPGTSRRRVCACSMRQGRHSR